MKTLYAVITVLFILVSSAMFAQPEGDVFPDFTVTDIEGEEHHLQSYLDDGKTVVIDVFATWCSICINSVPGFESLYNDLGQGGDESLVLLSFERDPNTSNEAAFAETHGVDSPIISEYAAVINESWNISGQPRYFVICPDGSFTLKPGGGIGSDPQQLIDIAGECAPVVNSVIESDRLEFYLTTVGIDYLYYATSRPVLDYEILDLTGSTVSKGHLDSTSDRIDISDMHNGIYLLAIRSKGEVKTLRFLKY